MHYLQAISSLNQFRSEIPTIVGNEMVNYALDNLHAERDVNGAPMKPRKPGSPRNEGRRILLDTGDGERSVRISKKTDREVELTANEYMEAHNTGATISGTQNVSEHTRRRRGRSETVRAHTRNVNFTLPERTFVAPTEELFDRIESALGKRFKVLTSS